MLANLGGNPSGRHYTLHGAIERRGTSMSLSDRRR